MQALRFLPLALAACAVLNPAAVIAQPPGAPPALRRLFQAPPDDARPMVRWWWFGPAVTRQGLERDMVAMKAAGIGGFEVQPVYPLTLDDPGRGLVNLPFLSPEFLDAFRFTADTAKRLGLRMDTTLGSGWPYGGPHVSADEGAMRLRVDHVPLGPAPARVRIPAPGAAERFLAAFVADGNEKSFKGARRLPVTADGHVEVPAADSGPRVVLFFSSGRTGMKVKRPAVGAEGLVLDHMSRAALEKHLSVVGDKLISAAGQASVYSVFCDSLEVFGSDWAGDMLAEFRQRRGYDLEAHLPVLAGGDTEEAASIRHDWGQTVTELFNERFLEPLQEWSRRNNTRSRVQAYGTPAASLTSYSFVDLPEGEGTGWDSLSSTRWAASAAHHWGQPQVSSETWTFTHPPHFRATPLDLKAVADMHFLAGVTQLIAHGWPYSPEQAGVPGWSFYATIALNDKNPWWNVMPDLARYLQRVSFMLRQGEPVNDVALYAPAHDGWAQFAPGRASLISHTRQRIGSAVVPALLRAGYNFDLADDTVITKLAKVEKGALVVNGHPYRIVVLPGVERIPVETLRKLSEFARAGGILIATRRVPDKAPGLLDQREGTPAVRKMVAELFGGTSARARLVGDDAAVAKVLPRLVQPDVRLSPAGPEVGFIHRRTPAADIYFMANTGNVTKRFDAEFRVTGGEAEWWDPHTGRTADARGRQVPGGVAVDVSLEPYGSRLLVILRGQARRGPAATVKAILPDAIELTGTWDVEFEDTGKKVRMESLKSWTELDGLRFYSGRATYSKVVSIPPPFMKTGVAVWLDFGQATPVPETELRGPRAWLDGPVREVAEVFVNAKRVGAVWHPPYRIELSGFLNAGQNEIKLVVANTAVNQQLGAPAPDYQALNAKYGVRFRMKPPEGPPLPSGLLVAPRIIAESSR